MMVSRLHWLLFFTLVAFTACAPAAPSATVQIPDFTNLQALPGFTQVDGTRPLTFPQDLGPHEGFSTEWWYYTGNLETNEGRPFGFELTIFRVGLVPPTVETPKDSKWYGRSLYF